MSTRSFLAIEPDDSVREALADAQRQVLARLRKHGLGEAARAVATHQIHLTLLFLGDVEDAALEEVAQEMARAAEVTREAALVVSSAGAFPRAGAPRVLWLGVEGEVHVLHQLHGVLEPSLKRLCPEMDPKPLKPHLTIGRVRPGAARGRSWQEALEEASFAPIRWSAREVSLLSSELTPRGPIYKRLATARLQGD
jgi:2'-5' RNA ligase